MACGLEQLPARQQYVRRTFEVRGIMPMFLSLPQYEFPVPEGLVEPGGKHWRVVEMPLHAPWYLLTVEQPPSDDVDWAPTHTLCIAWETDLADAIQTVDAARVRGLVAMIPAWASPTGQWSSRQICEVWLDTSEAGKVVTLLDAAGKTVDAGSFMEPAKDKPAGELLLRLRPNAPALRSRMAGARRFRKRSSRAR
jgi:hypothetical protein